MADERYQVFLSYNSADRPAVLSIANRLRQANIQAWLDQDRLIPGEPWMPAIEAALSRSDNCAVFFGPNGRGLWQDEEMQIAINKRVQSRGGFRVIPVLLPGAERAERSTLPDFLKLVTWVEFRKSVEEDDSFELLLRGILRNNGAAPAAAPVSNECPYRGLQVFDVDQSSIFFGRDVATSWLVDALRPPAGTRPEIRFLALVGCSGSGKSSLARAGLIAALKNGAIEGSAKWPVIICRPGVNPLEELAVAFTDGKQQVLGSVRQMMDDLRKDQNALHLSTRLLLREAPPETRLVLLVDQFEETFTRCHDEAIRKAFVDNLVYPASVAGSQLIVVLALRADFYGECATYPGLAAALSDHQYLVGPMQEAELREAIERPAQLARCTFDPGLVDLLLDEMRGQPGSLPLLQYTLRELWNRREGDRMTHAAFEQIGRVQGALGRKADEIYNQFSDAEKRLCRRLLLRLVQHVEGSKYTRRRAEFSELITNEAEKDTVQEIVRKLADEQSRLLTVEGEDQGRIFVEIAHEALINGWGELRRWLDDDQDYQRWQRRLDASLADWKSMRDSGNLLRGAPLIEAQRWLSKRPEDLNRAETDFINASVAFKKREAAKRLWTIVASLAAFFALVSGWAFSFYRESRIAQAGELAARAFHLTDTDPDSSVWLAMYAVDKMETRESREALHKAVQAAQAAALQGHRGVVNDVAFGPNGAILATASADATARLWKSDFYWLKPPLPHDAPATAVSFTADGKRLATADTSGVIKIWQVDSKQLLQTLPKQTEGISALIFRPDNALLAACWDGSVKLWDVNAPREIETVAKQTDPVKKMSLSRDGARLATVSGVNVARVWDTKTHAEIGQFTNGTEIVADAAFSPDGKLLATAGANGTAMVWSVERRAPLVTLAGHVMGINSVAFSPDGKWIATGSIDRTARMWVASTGEETISLFGNQEPLVRVAFSPDGKRLATAGVDQSARIFELEFSNLKRVAVEYAKSPKTRRLTNEECRKYLYAKVCPDHPFGAFWNRN